MDAGLNHRPDSVLFFPLFWSWLGALSITDSIDYISVGRCGMLDWRRYDRVSGSALPSCLPRGVSDTVGGDYVVVAE